MKIDWKHIATTPGYKSLKASYIDDVVSGRSFDSKEQLYVIFLDIIGRAKHYAHCKGVTVDVILNEWESKRDYWWINYYQYSNRPKKHSNSLKPVGIRGIRKNLRKVYGHTDIGRKHHMCNHIQRLQRNKSEKDKPRWSREYKLGRRRRGNLSVS